MECTFQVGQKVVCVDASQFAHRLTEGSVYTVSAVGVDFGAVFIGLEETIEGSPGELHWHASRFRPVFTKTADITVFKSMLNPLRVKESA